MRIKAISLVTILAVIALALINVYFNKSEKKLSKTAPPLPSLTPSTNNPRSSLNSSKESPSVAKIEIKNFSPRPEVLKVKPNTLVTFTNFDEDSHQIQGANWQSRILKKNNSFSQIFEIAGNYYYADPQNSQLQGLIIVSP